MEKFNADNVLSVYSGRQGCACGCRGKYTYNPAFLSEASKDRGYPITEDDNQNPRSLRAIVAIFNAHLADVKTDSPSEFYMEIGERLYMLQTVAVNAQEVA